jgi:hypothetical protein
MGSRHILAALGLLLAPCAAAAAEIDDFFGDWRGVEVSIDAPKQSLELKPADLEMSLAGEGGGFRLHSFGLARGQDGGLLPRPFDAVFVLTETPGVFAFQPAAGSLLSRLFADPSTGNPLEGDTLLWARLQDDVLHVYSLAIDERGGFALAHTTAQLAEDGMLTGLSLRLENEQIVTVEGLLERVGD